MGKLREGKDRTLSKHVTRMTHVGMVVHDRGLQLGKDLNSVM